MGSTANKLLGIQTESQFSPEIEGQMESLMTSYNILLEKAKHNGDPVQEYNEQEVRSFIEQTVEQFVGDGTKEYMEKLVSQSNTFCWLAVPTGLSHQTFKDMMNPDWHFGKILNQYAANELSGEQGESGIRIIAITEQPVEELFGDIDKQKSDFDSDKQTVGSLIEPNIADGFAYWNAKTATGENPRIRIVQSHARREQVGIEGKFNHVPTFRVSKNGEIDLGGALTTKPRETYRAVGRTF